MFSRMANRKKEEAKEVVENPESYERFFSFMDVKYFEPVQLGKPVTPKAEYKDTIKDIALEFAKKEVDTECLKKFFDENECGSGYGNGYGSGDGRTRRNKMDAMKYENVEPILYSHPNIHYAKDDREEFHRSFAFSINDQFYSIVWFKNVMTLHFNGGCELKFSSFKLSGTWPNRAIWNLQFEDDRGETVCVIPVEDARSEH